MGDWKRGIGRVVCISLRDEGAARREVMGPLLEEWGLQWRTMTHMTERPVRTKEPSLRVRMGELGCALAHREAVELAAADEAPSVLVLEDDVRRYPEVPWEEVATMMEALECRDDWDVVNLGGCAADWRPGTPAFGSERYVPGVCRRVHGMVSTHAVVYHARAYEAVLTAVPPREVSTRQYANLVKPRAYDEWLHQTLRVVAPLRPVMYQTGEDSAILAGGAHVIDVRAAIERTGVRLREAETMEMMRENEKEVAA